MKTALNEIPTLLRWARFISETYDVTVQFADVPAPCMKGKNIYLPYLTSHTTEEDIIKLRHAILHEAWHVYYGSGAVPTEEMAKAGLTTNAGMPNLILQVVEDHRIEQNGTVGYAGDAFVVSEAMRMHTQTTPANFAEALRKAKPENRKRIAAFMATMMVDVESREKWMPSSAEILSNFEDHAPPDVIAMRDALKNAGVIDDLKRLPPVRDGDGERATMHLTRKIWRTLFGEDPPPVTPPENCTSKQAVHGNGTGNQKIEGTRAAQAEKEGEEKSGKGDNLEFQEYRKLRNEPVTDWTLKDEGGGPKLTYADSDFPGGSWMYDPNHVTAYHCQRDIWEPEGMSQGNRKPCPGDAARFPPPSDNIRKMANALRRLLQTEAQLIYRGGHKTGRLHQRVLFRAALPQMGATSEKVWRKQQTNRKMLDTSVSIVIDVSGSMSGKPVQVAMAGAQLLQAALARSLHVPVEVITFTSGGRGCYVNVLAEFGKPVSQDQLAMYAGFACRSMGGTPMSPAVIWAGDRLMRQPTQKKVMICLTDGSPNGWGDEPQWLKTYVAELDARPDCDVYGIGIQHAAVNHFFEKHVIVNDIDELPELFINLVKRSMYGGISGNTNK